jgi:hypothetical protein
MTQRSATNSRTTNPSGTGMAKKSAARAKPARDAAQTVRAAPTKKHKASGAGAGRQANYATMSKDEKKEARRVERDEQDRATSVSNILVTRSDDYKKKRRMWWLLLILGLAMTALSWLLMTVIPDATTNNGSIGFYLAMGSLIGAYVFIIGAFIYDFAVLRKFRKAADSKAAGMTAKKQQEIIDDDYAEREERRAAKKGSKKGPFGKKDVDVSAASDDAEKDAK